VSILQAVWALGNVACDSYSSRDIVLQHGALVPLLLLFNGRTKLSILWKATWALGIFCRSLPPDKFEHV
jgi:importin subunit alpha-6/7